MHHQTVTEAIATLRQGGVIAYPTEGVWGLGCDPDAASAVQRILHLKQRPQDKGLILIAGSWEQLAPYLLPLNEEIQQRIFPTWPGPVTWLLPAQPRIPQWLRGNHDTLAVRITAHPLCRELCLGFGKPVVSTSANPAGQAPARTASDVEAYFPRGIDALINGSTGAATTPSEIRDALTGNRLR